MKNQNFAYDKKFIIKMTVVIDAGNFKKQSKLEEN